MDAAKKVSVIIMAFNEANSLNAFTRELCTILDDLQCSSEVLIINDGSSDQTGEIAERLSKELPQIRVIHHETNRGLGGVYRTGFANAKGEVVTFFPADGQFPADIVSQFIPLIDRADVVLGYVSNRRSSLLSLLLSKAERVLYTLLFGRLPRFQGIFMARHALIDKYELKSTGRGWAVLMELIIRAKKDGYKLISVPTEMRPRLSGVSKVNNAANIWSNLRQVINLKRYC